MRINSTRVINTRIEFYSILIYTYVDTKVVLLCIVLIFVLSTNCSFKGYFKGSKGSKGQKGGSPAAMIGGGLAVVTFLGVGGYFLFGGDSKTCSKYKKCPAGKQKKPNVGKKKCKDNNDCAKKCCETHKGTNKAHSPHSGSSNAHSGHSNTHSGHSNTHSGHSNAHSGHLRCPPLKDWQSGLTCPGKNPRCSDDSDGKISYELLNAPKNVNRTKYHLSNISTPASNLDVQAGRTPAWNGNVCPAGKCFAQETSKTSLTRRFKGANSNTRSALCVEPVSS